MIDLEEKHDVFVSLQKEWAELVNTSNSFFRINLFLTRENLSRTQMLSQILEEFLDLHN